MVGKLPSQRCGAVGCSVTVCWERSGAMILTCICWLLAVVGVPGGRSTVRCAVPPTMVALTLRELSGVGSVQVTRLAHQRAASLHVSQLAVQRPRASLVQAATRPRPYCQTASTGSSRWLINTNCAVGLGVVAT